MKKLFLIVGIMISFLLFPFDFLVNADEENNEICPGVSDCCESGYNVMCAMEDPLKNYYVTDKVCGNRGGGVYHYGMDLTRGSGDGQIYAALTGKVIATTNNGKNCAPGGSLLCSPIECSSSKGISVTILVTEYPFEGYMMDYMHMSSLNVKVGDVVTKGQAIGVIGNTGCSTGEHLHFQINNYNGDPIDISPYFLDKTSYICGGGNLSATNKPIYNDYDNLSQILKDENGETYKAEVGDCIGALNGQFYQGISLLSKDNSGTISVYAVEGGKYVSGRQVGCGNGVTIRTAKGEFHTYCHLGSGSIPYNEGDYIETGAYIGTMGIDYATYEKKLFFSVQRYGKYIDMSMNFLNIYGGRCRNSNRDNCRTITDNVQYFLCNSIES